MRHGINVASDDFQPLAAGPAAPVGGAVPVAALDFGVHVLHRSLMAC